MFAIFNFGNAVGHKQVLLGFSLFKNKDTQDAMEHFSYTSYTLKAHNKEFHSVATKIGNSTNIKNTFARRVAVSFGGGASHCFNFVGKAFPEA